MTYNNLCSINCEMNQSEIENGEEESSRNMLYSYYLGLKCNKIYKEAEQKKESMNEMNADLQQK